MKSRLGGAMIAAGLGAAGAAEGLLAWPRWCGPDDNALVAAELTTLWSADSNLAWRIALPGRGELAWDIGASPVLTSNPVVVAVMNGPRSHLAAWDRDTGRLAWSVPRADPCAHKADQGYTTPIALSHRGRESILVWDAEHVTLHNARDGAMIWDCGGLNPEGRSNWPPVASPVLAGEGDATATAHRWRRSDTGSYVAAPLVWQARRPLLRDWNEVDCFDPSAGRTLRTGLFERSAWPFCASPLIAGGRLYAAREDGGVFVAQIDGEFRRLARNAMGERIWASSGSLGRRLLLRGERALFCVGPRVSATSPIGS